MVWSEIWLEEPITNEKLKQALRNKGVKMGYPYLQVSMTSQRLEFQIGEIFKAFGYTMEVDVNRYIARKDMEEIEV